MKNNTKLIVALVAVGALVATVFAFRSTTMTNLISQEDVVTQTGESMDENLSDIAKAKKKLKEATDAHVKNPSVDANTDAKAYVEAIGAPSEEDLARIEKDETYGEEGFDTMMREFMRPVFKDMSEDTIKKMLRAGIEDVYRFKTLSDQYAYGEIDRAFWVGTTYQSSLMHDRELASILTDEQYASYSGDVPKDQELPNGLAVLATDEAIFLDFPNIMKVHPEMQSIDELYALVDPAIVADVSQFNRDHRRAGMRLDIQVERGEITFDDYMEISEKDNVSYNRYLRSILTSEQQDIFLGEKVDYEALQREMKEDDNIDDEEYDDSPIVEGDEDWNDLIKEGATPEQIREFNETGVISIPVKEKK